MDTQPRDVVLTPPSPKAAALIHALQAELLSNIEAANQVVPPGSIVLRDLGAASSSQQYWEDETHGTRIVQCEFAHGRLSLRNFRTDARYPSLHGGLWYADEERIDLHGRTWRSPMAAHFVFDDFGDLVPVAECAS